MNNKALDRIINTFLNGDDEESARALETLTAVLEVLNEDRVSNHIRSSKVPRRFVETIERSGAKVFVQHYRWVTTKTVTCERYLEHVTDKNHNQFAIESKGGLTRVQVSLPDGRELGGEAVCSDSDNYDRKLGVYLAIKRAFGEVAPIPEGLIRLE